MNIDGKYQLQLCIAKCSFVGAIVISILALLFTRNIIFSYWLFAIFISFFYGFAAQSIFLVKDPEENKLVWAIWPWRLHQIWFNFIGSVVGWSVAYYLVNKFFVFSLLTENVGVVDIILLIIAVIGLTGHLPMTIAVLTNAVTEIFKILLEKLMNLFGKN